MTVKCEMQQRTKGHSLATRTGRLLLHRAASCIRPFGLSGSLPNAHTLGKTHS